MTAEKIENYSDTRFRVRYAETDKMGVVHHATYLIWFEVGRTEYSIERKFPYNRVEEEGIILVVADAKIRYKTPCTYDDEVIVRTWISKSHPRVCHFNYIVMNAETEAVICEGQTVHVPLNRETMRPSKLPKEFLEAMGQ